MLCGRLMRIERRIVFILDLKIFFRSLISMHLQLLFG